MRSQLEEAGPRALIPGNELTSMDNGVKVHEANFDTAHTIDHMRRLELQQRVIGFAAYGLHPRGRPCG
jgi:hypothetical protein